MSWVDGYKTTDLASKAAGENGNADCTVRAWVNCFDAPYASSHAWMKKHGRRNNKGMTYDEVVNALKACKKAKIRIGPYSYKNRITVKQFCAKHSVGRYYVLSKGHAYCIKNGVVHDYKYGGGRQITMAARVYLEGEYVK
jgi:hypothetical protein